jgi:hypothetical protein
VFGLSPGGDRTGIRVLAVPPADQPYLVGLQEVKPAAGLEATVADFPLKRGVWVQGRVTDKVTGKPVRAYMHYEPTTDNPQRGDVVDFTDFYSLPAYRCRPDGSYRVPALPGPGVLTARELFYKKEHLGDGSAPVNPSKDSKWVQCDIALDPGRTLTGTILDPDGKPLASVQAFNADPVDYWTPRALPTASFRVIAVDPRGRRSLVFLHRDKRLAKALELPGDARDPVTVQLERAGAVIGRLVDADGKPRPDAGLGIYFVRKDNDSTATHLPVQIRTDRAGRFCVEGLAPGVVYQIIAWRRGTIADRLSIQPGETRDLGDVKGKPSQE